MKIALLSYYHGTVERGVENWATEVKHRLSAEVTIFSQSTTGSPFILQVLPKLISQHFDIVIPTGGRLEAIVVKLLSLFKPFKIIIFGHSGQGWDDRLNLYTFPDVFVALSDPAATWAKSVNPWVSVRTIPIGVDLDFFTPAGPKAKLTLTHPLIIVAAAAILSKQLDLTIKAVAGTTASLLILSNSGSETLKLQSLGKSLLGGRFALLGVPHRDVAKYYRSADLFTLTSWVHESFPAVYLEALACNLPVVATNDPIRRAMMGNAGLFVDPQNTQAYSKALTEALGRKWGTTPRTQAQKYSWTTVINDYDRLCRELIS